MIELKQLTIETRHPILNGANYVFEDGKIYGIVAENGSGKTTLFRTMVNLKNPKSGTILFDNLSVDKKLNQIFYFETIEWLDPNLSGYDYLNFVKKQWKSNIDTKEIIQVWNMEGYIKLPIRKYSLGMKQRLIISLYLISGVRYMIMDEITSGLDEENRYRFFGLLENLRKQGKTILISSHYKEEILQSCDIVLGIKNQALFEVSS